MYLRTTARRRKDGSVACYLRLAHNVWDPKKGRSRAEIIYSFGREDEVNRRALERLVGSVTRFFSPKVGVLTRREGIFPFFGPGSSGAPTSSTPSGAASVSMPPYAASFGAVASISTPRGWSLALSPTGTWTFSWRSPPLWRRRRSPWKETDGAGPSQTAGTKVAGHVSKRGLAFAPTERAGTTGTIYSRSWWALP